MMYLSGQHRCHYESLKALLSVLLSERGWVEGTRR